MAYRRQKRWWNAYILFYERQDEVEDEKRIYKSLQDLTIGWCTFVLPMSLQFMPNCKCRTVQIVFVRSNAR